ncbi:MAG: glycerophosphodiester phosphodiesterase family protein [Bacteroidales bacterium]|nr:glycerophosphodiester phosphodiesterase family protein [Bacteroidales bacterium]
MKHLVISAMLILAGTFCQAQSKFDLQGHRGCRGLMPENTIPAFIKAIDLGATTIELDVFPTKDRQLVISHESYMMAATCLDSLGREIKKSDEKNFRLYQMTMDQIRKFDCGSKSYPAFPQQQRIKAYKPSLIEMVAAVEEYVKQKGLPPVWYKIEIKSSESGDDVEHPKPAPYMDLLINEIISMGIASHCVFQSFDVRPLQYLHDKHPNWITALLLSNNKSMKENIALLGYTPQIYSPDQSLVTRKLVRQVHRAGMQIIPWTVNKKDDMLKLIDLGVDAIITDYPGML